MSAKIESPAFVVEPRGYRIKDAATYMGLTPWFIEEEIRADRLPALQLCRHYTVLREDMDTYLDQAKGQAYKALKAA